MLLELMLLELRLELELELLVLRLELALLELRLELLELRDELTLLELRLLLVLTLRVFEELLLALREFAVALSLVPVLRDVPVLLPLLALALRLGLVLLGRS